MASQKADVYIGYIGTLNFVQFYHHEAGVCVWSLLQCILIYIHVTNTRQLIVDGHPEVMIPTHSEAILCPLYWAHKCFHHTLNDDGTGLYHCRVSWLFSKLLLAQNWKYRGERIWDFFNQQTFWVCHGRRKAFDADGPVIVASSPTIVASTTAATPATSAPAIAANTRMTSHGTPHLKNISNTYISTCS